MSQPNLDQIPTWDSFDRNIIEIFTRALIYLASEKSLHKNENSLNTKVYHFSKIANSELRKTGKGLIGCPVIEASIQPRDENDEPSTGFQNRPDIQWTIFDDQAQGIGNAYLYYTIECKRLGEPESTSWIFNENYVDEGIVRFIKDDKGYAKDVDSGMMIGYIQSSSPSEILKDVNSRAEARKIPPISLTSGNWVIDGPTRLDRHELNRNYQPQRFFLNHIWVDLRSCEFQEPEQIAGDKAEPVAKPKVRKKRKPAQKKPASND